MSNFDDKPPGYYGDKDHSNGRRWEQLGDIELSAEDTARVEAATSQADKDAEAYRQEQLNKTINDQAAATKETYENYVHEQLDRLVTARRTRVQRVDNAALALAEVTVGLMTGLFKKVAEEHGIELPTPNKSSAEPSSQSIWHEQIKHEHDHDILNARVVELQVVLSLIEEMDALHNDPDQILCTLEEKIRARLNSIYPANKE